MSNILHTQVIGKLTDTQKINQGEADTRQRDGQSCSCTLNRLCRIYANPAEEARSTFPSLYCICLFSTVNGTEDSNKSVTVQCRSSQGKSNKGEDSPVKPWLHTHLSTFPVWVRDPVSLCNSGMYMDTSTILILSIKEYTKVIIAHMYWKMVNNTTRDGFHICALSI